MAPNHNQGNQNEQKPAQPQDEQKQPQAQDEQQNDTICGMEPDVYRAAISGSKNKLQLLEWKDMRTPLGNNVLHVYSGKPLKGVVLSEDDTLNFISYVLTVLETTSSDNSVLLQTNKNGDTSLHLAVRFGHVVAVELFLKWPQLRDGDLTELMNKSNKNGDTALHEAARAGRAPVVRLLLDATPDNSVHHMPNIEGETPLYLAAEKGCVESFSSILEFCKELEHKGPCGLTALHVAVLCRNQEVVAKIVEYDSKLITVKNDQGQTALHCAAAQHVQDLGILQNLLSGENPYHSAAYIQDNKGQTPLHLAVLSWNFIGVEKIIQFYPDCIEISDNNMQNVVHYAANLGCLRRLKEFLEHAPSCDRLLSEKDQNGDTPLHLVAATTPSIPSHGCFVILAKFIKQYDYILDVNAYNKQNRTAGDIIASNTSLNHFAAAPPKVLCKLLPRSRRKNNSTEDDKNMNLKKVEDRISTLKKTNETRLVVAALIATVSFTAGFTVPGGFHQDTGLAVFARKAAFQAFLVSDTIAFTLSSLAIMCYFLAAKFESFVRVDRLSIKAHLLNSISLGALMIAFVAGVSAVVTNVPWLVCTIIVVSLFYFYWYLFLVLGRFGGFLAFMTRNSYKTSFFLRLYSLVRY